MTETKTDRILQDIIHLKSEDFTSAKESSGGRKALVTAPSGVIAPAPIASSTSSEKGESGSASSKTIEEATFPEPVFPMTQQGPEGVR